MSFIPTISGAYPIRRDRNLKRGVAAGGAPVGPSYPLVTFSQIQATSPEGDITSAPAVLASRAAFEALLLPFQTMTFEAMLDGTQMLNGSFTINGVTVQSTGAVGLDPAIRGLINNAGPVPQGRYNTTESGSLYWDALGTSTIAEANPTFLTFTPAISFFGLYITDIGDFFGDFTIRLHATDLTTTDIVVSSGFIAVNAALAFFGFCDAQKTYNKIEFFSDASYPEAWGVDDITFGPYSLLAP